jgi:hypothetical protein
VPSGKSGRKPSRTISAEAEATRSKVGVDMQGKA